MPRILEEGDIILNHTDDKAIVTSVQYGKNGILIIGRFLEYPKSEELRVYLPYELPPVEDINNWNGWARRSKVTLSNGFKLGYVSYYRIEDSMTLEACEKRWRSTINIIRNIEGVVN